MPYTLVLKKNKTTRLISFFSIPPGSTIEFPLLFTENPNFDVRRYLAKDEATEQFLDT